MLLMMWAASGNIAMFRPLIEAIFDIVGLDELPLTPILNISYRAWFADAESIVRLTTSRPMEVHS